MNEENMNLRNIKEEINTNQKHEVQEQERGNRNKKAARAHSLKEIRIRELERNKTTTKYDEEEL